MKKNKIQKVFAILIILQLILAMIPVPNYAANLDNSIMFQDFEGAGEMAFAEKNAKGTLTEEDAFEGDWSLKYEVETSGDPSESERSIVISAMNGPVDASSMEYLIFSLKDTQGSNTLKVSLIDESGKATSFGWQDPKTKHNEWIYYQIPLTKFSGVDMTKISKVRIGQWNSGVYFVDNMYFSNVNPPVDLVRPTGTQSGTFENYAIVELKSDYSSFPIYYTIDGSNPDKNSLLYTGLLRLDTSVTLKAVVYNPDHDMYSEISTFEYIVNNDSSSLKPKALPSPGTYSESQEVSLSTILKDAEIYYTLDGGNPTKSSTKYTGPISISADTTIKAVAIQGETQTEVSIFEYRLNETPSPFLKANGTKLLNNFGSGEEVVLRGTNAGGWLVMEEWMNPVKSPDQITTIRTLTERFGEEGAWELLNIYQDHYFTEKDFDILKEEGINSIRLPITYFEMLNEDGSLKETAFDRLDWFIEEASKREIYVIIDLHGAPGSQNGKDHSGDISNKDKGNLYGNETNMQRTVFLWEEIAKRYKDAEWVAGYDLLNEPGGASGIEQFDFYNRLYQAVRAQDQNHILFIEAIWEPKDLPNPNVYGWENVAYSYHFYNWNNIHDFYSQKDFIDSKVSFVEEANHNVPVYVGEFTMFNNIQSWDYALKVFEEQGWSFSTWAYKATGNGTSWGMYTGEPASVDIHNDSFEEIKVKWSTAGTDVSYKRNDYFVDVLRNYFDPTNRDSDAMKLIADFEGLEENTLLETGENAIAFVDPEKQVAGEASAKLVVFDDSDINKSYISLKVKDGQVFNLVSENNLPNYLIFDIYNGTNQYQTAQITFIDKDGNQAIGVTQEFTPALSKTWSKIHLLLDSISGEVNKSEIVEIRIGFKDIGAYNLDNIFIGQSFANNLSALNAEPGTEEPGTEEPGEEPDTQEPGTEEPGEEPGTQEPGTEEPGEEPGTQEPGTEEPGTQEPGNEEPGTNDSGTPQTDKDHNKLPDTSVATYNYLSLGAIFLILGGFLFNLNRKKIAR